MVFNNNLLLGAAGQGGGVAPFDTTLIGNSVWLDGSADYLSRTTTSHSTSKFTVAFWLVLNNPSSTSLNGFVGLGTGASGATNSAIGTSSNAIYFQSNGYSATSKMLLRDIGFYHIIASWDLSQSGTAKGKVFVNGVDLDSSGWATDGRGSWGASFGSTANQDVGRMFATNYHDGYITQVVWLDGQSIQNGDIAATDFYDTYTFGTNGSQFIPKADADIAALASTAGGNSFCLDFADSADLGNDISSNNNDFTPNSMSSANQSISTPSLVFPTFSALNISSLTSLSEGNLKAVGSGTEVSGVWATRPISAGETIYFEGTWGSTSGWGYFGVSSKTNHDEVTSTFNADSSTHIFQLTPTASNRGVASAGSALFTGKTTWTTTDTFQIAIDINNGKLWFGVNNSWYDSGGTTTGDPAAGTNPTVTFTAETPMFVVAQSGGASSINVNFGQDSQNVSTGNADENGYGDFEFAPPSGFLAFCSANLTAPDYQGIDYFDSTLYEGNGTGQRVGDFVPFTDSYTVDNSAMLDDGDTRYFERTPGGAGNRKTFTLSTWFKRSNITGATQYLFHCQNSGNNNLFTVQFNASDQIVAGGEISGGATDKKVTTNRVFKDTSQWYHLVVRVDTPQATAADRLRIYINGVEQSLASAAYRATTEDWLWNAASELHTIARGQSSGSASGTSSDLYLAETVHIDGTSLGPDSFGQLDTSTNRWIPKDVSGLTFGTNGFYLEYKGTFGTSNGAGDDSSGNSPANNFTEGGTWATSDQFTDTPSQNFDNLGGAQVGGTISEGNTKAALGTGGNQIRSNFNLSSGKWYVESDIQATNNSASIGLVPSRSATWSNGPGRDANGGISYETDGDVYSDNVQNATAEASFAAGDVVQMAIDMDAKKVYFGKNNTFGGDPAAGTGGHSLPTSILSDGAALITLGNYSGTQASTQQINYGQFLNFDGGSTTNGFKYTPPTGFKAVNQDNLDDTASKITAWAWIKNRDSTDSHILVDRVRGVGEVLHSDLTDLEATEPNTVQRFLQRGVQVGSDVQVNTANESYVLWQWLVGEAATTTTINASTTTPTNSIASTVAAADAGHFSVVGYQGNSTNGATVAHSLGGEPELIFFRGREGSGATSFLWRVFSTTGGAGQYLRLNDSTALQADTGYLNNTLPGSVVFTLGTDGDVNNSNYTYVAYCFRSVPGVCKIGTYIGNNTDDNAYVSLGFKPRFFMCKMTTGSSNWHLIDSARSPTNEGQIQSFANLNNAEQNSALGAYDILSDGIKIRSDAGYEPGNTGTWLYMAMADIAGNGTLPPIYGR